MNNLLKILLITFFFPLSTLAQELEHESIVDAQNVVCSEVDFRSTKAVTREEILTIIGNLPLVFVHYDGSQPTVDVSINVTDHFCVGVESVDGAYQSLKRSQMQEINSVLSNNSPTYKSNQFQVTPELSGGLWVVLCVKDTTACYTDGVLFYVGASS